MSNSKLDVLVLAGEGEKMINYAPLLQQANVTNKAFIKLAGKPMINYVLEALNDAELVGSITLVGLTKNQTNFEFTKPINFIAGGKTTFESLKLGVEHYAENNDLSKFILTISSDIPLITSEMIDRFIASIDFTNGKEYYYPIVWVDTLLKYFPNVTKVPMKVTEGSFYGADLHIFQLSTILKRTEILEELLGMRKNFLKIVRFLSIPGIIRYKLGKINFAWAENFFRKRFELNSCFAIIDFPEACADLDYLKDLEEFEKLCSQPPRKLNPNDGVSFISAFW